VTPAGTAVANLLRLRYTERVVGRNGSSSLISWTSTAPSEAQRGPTFHIELSERFKDPRLAGEQLQ
jgi:hypothetical protein